MSTSERQPPRFATWLVHHSLAPREREYVLGDLHEGFDARAEAHGPRAAARWYVSQAWRSSASNIGRRGRGACRAVFRLVFHPVPVPPPVRGDSMLASILHDVRFGMRLLLRQPARSLVLVLTLALGIGANAALFTLVNAVVLRPLPYPDAERLVRIWDRNERAGLWFFSASVPHYFGWRDSTQGFEAMGAYREDGFTLARADGPVAIEGVRMTASLFDVLRIAPVLGRPFLADEDRPGGPPVAVVSHEFWRRELQANPAVVGEAITLNGLAHTVVGVMPATFQFPQRDRADVLVPYGLARDPDNDGSHFLRVLARMKAGQSPQTVKTELAGAAGRYNAEAPASQRGWTAALLPLHEAVVGSVRETLIRLQGACLLVLLIATVNVANLLIVRAASRSREIAVRAALGAGTMRLVRQLLTESLVLAALGSLAGLALAQVLLGVAPVWLPDSLPRMSDLSMDRTVVLFSIAISLATGVLFGVAPAVGPALRATGPTSSGASRGATVSQSLLVRRLLVGVQLGLALTLLAGAALLVQSSLRLATTDRGFTSSGVLTFDVKPPARAYVTREQRALLYRQIVDRLRALPGVLSVGLTHRAPFTGSSSVSFRVAGRPADAPAQQVNFRSVSEDYFDALGVTLVRGRAFQEEEVWERGGAVIINQAAARKFWPNEDPIGQRIVAGDNPAFDVIGIAADTSDRSLSGTVDPAMYVPYVRWPVLAMTLVIRTAVDPATLSAAAAHAVAQADPQLPISGVQTMDQRMREVLAQPRFNSMLASVFAVLALVLAAVGVYGVIGCLVAARTREFGIRLALGAQPGQVLRHVLAEGVRMAIVGIVLGVGAALAFGRLLADLLYDVTPSDPPTLAVTSVTLFVIALAAAVVPARRVLRVDPVRTLNEQ